MQFHKVILLLLRHDMQAINPKHWFGCLVVAWWPKLYTPIDMGVRHILKSRTTKLHVLACLNNNLYLSVWTRIFWDPSDGINDMTCHHVILVIVLSSSFHSSYSPYLSSLLYLSSSLSPYHTFPCFSFKIILQLQWKLHIYICDKKMTVFNLGQFTPTEHETCLSQTTQLASDVLRNIWSFITLFIWLKHI